MWLWNLMWEENVQYWSVVVLKMHVLHTFILVLKAEGYITIEKTVTILILINNVSIP